MKDNSKTAYRRIGASNHSESERETNDFYATEPKALELLLELEKFDDLVWEPACGKGHLSEVLIKNGYIVISTDLIDRGYGKGGIDFLQLEETTKFFGDIITNPPYSKAKEFVEKALNIICDGNRVAMFLKLTFLESKSRRELFENTPPNTYMCHQAVYNVPKMVILNHILKAQGQQSPMGGSFGGKVLTENQK